MSSPLTPIDVVVPPTLSTDQLKIIQVVTDLITKKLTSKEEALELLNKLEFQIGTWVASQLPSLEGKALLASLWAVEQVKSGCFSFFEKSS